MPMIDELYAFVAEEEPGSEGLCAAFINGAWMPLVAADPARVRSLLPFVDVIEKETGKRPRLIRFSTRVEVDPATFCQ